MFTAFALAAAAARFQQPPCDARKTISLPHVRGVGHCGGGVGPDRADFLGALERWREAGEAPSQIPATRAAGRGGQTPMSRPLCPHPQVARYNASGSTDDAKNFTCVVP